MGKSFPLQTLLDLSRLRLDEATRKLGELLAGEQEAGARLALLQQYRAEYHTRFVTAARDGLGRTALANYQSFLVRLDDAITQAEGLLEQSRQRTATGQQEWIGQRGRLQAFDTLAQRHRDQQQHAENRKEQKQSDEHAARKHAIGEDTSLPPHKK